MIEPPSSSVFTRYVLENPWPLGIVALAIAAILLWLGLRDGRSDRLKAGGVFGALGLVVILAGVIVTTAGENGALITRQLVERAVAGDVAASMNLLTADAVLTVGRPENPGVGVNVIRDSLTRLTTRYRIESNSITDLDAFSESSDKAVVFLTCITDAGFGPTNSRWVLEVIRDADDQWRVDRVTCLDINNQTPPSGLFGR